MYGRHALQMEPVAVVVVAAPHVPLRALVWAEGHYNGPVKTRKTVQPGGEDEDDGGEAAGSGKKAARRRSRQLRELYDSLAGEAAAAGGGGGRRIGGRARRWRRRTWRRRSGSTSCAPPTAFLRDSGCLVRHLQRERMYGLVERTKSIAKCFRELFSQRVQASRQLHAFQLLMVSWKSEQQRRRVEEDIGLIQYARSIFMDQHGIHMMPTLSGHSTSNPITHIDDPPLQIKMEKHIVCTNVQPQNLNPEDKRSSEMEEDDDQLDTECASDLDTNNGKGSCQPAPLNYLSNEQATPYAGSSGQMHVEVSDRARYGCSSYVDEEIEMQMVGQNTAHAQTSLQGQDRPGQWDVLYDNLCSGYLLEPSAAEDQAIPPENAHYAETVLRILSYNMRQQTTANIKAYLAVCTNSPFSRWNTKRAADVRSTKVSECTPQRMLKGILFSVHSSQGKSRGEAQSPEPRDGEGMSRSRRGQVQAELSASHVLKERRRREKLNERFVVLRSLVPFVTKMDRASILADTIEYLKQLRRRIQDLESRPRQTIDGNMPPATSHETRGYVTRASTGKRAAEASGSSTRTPAEVQVSIIESDALLELRCPHRDGLLLRVMQALHRDLRMEVTSVQASSAGGVLLAELRAKVNEAHGRRSSIIEVKRAIHMILSSD
ncbi:hypothetical protein EJB05_13484, partial [Eragrostis curvula]